MLHTKFRGNRATDSGEEFECFHHIWAWRPSWPCDPDATNELCTPTHIGSTQNLAMIDQMVFIWKIRCWNIDDGQRLDAS